MPTASHTLDLPSRLVPQNAAQAELIKQLAHLQAELDRLDQAIDHACSQHQRRLDEPKAETLARAYANPRNNPLPALTRERRAVQNQYWKLVKLFYQLAKVEDQPADADEAKTDAGQSATTSDGADPSTPSQPATPPPTRKRGYAPIFAQPSRWRKPAPLQSACQPIADGLRERHGVDIPASTGDTLPIAASPS